MVNLRGDNAKKGSDSETETFLQTVGLPKKCRAFDTLSRLTLQYYGVMSGVRSGFGPNATSPLRFQWRGGVRSVSVSRLSILGIKTGRGIGHTTRGRKEEILSFLSRKWRSSATITEGYLAAAFLAEICQNMLGNLSLTISKS